MTLLIVKTIDAEGVSKYQARNQSYLYSQPGEVLFGMFVLLHLKMLAERFRKGTPATVTHLCVFAVLTLTFAHTSYSQSSLFSGEITYGNSAIKYQISLVETANRASAYFTSTDLNAFEIPCQKTTFQNGILKFYVISDYYTYEYSFIKDRKKFEGTLKVFSNQTQQLLNNFQTNLIPNPPNDRTSIERQDLTFQSNGLKLFGTLWKPRKPNGRGIFFVTSSHGNDRSGTNAEADYFANLGYSIFNYDKRGTGKSEGNWQSASIEELASDDIAAVQFFSKISAIPLSNIGIKGSSQGGIKVPYILTKLPELGFGISVSSPGGTLLESDLNYWKNSNRSRIGTSNFGIATKIQKAGFDYLAGNITFKKLDKIKSAYVNRDWYKHIWIPERKVEIDRKLNFTGLPYFKKINQPILVIQGMSDDVIPKNSYKTIRKAIRKSKNHTVLTLINTTHSMTLADNEFAYFPKLNPQYLSAVTNWLRGIQFE